MSSQESAHPAFDRPKVPHAGLHKVRSTLRDELEGLRERQRVGLVSGLGGDGTRSHERGVSLVSRPRHSRKRGTRTDDELSSDEHDNRRVGGGRGVGVQGRHAVLHSLEREALRAPSKECISGLNWDTRESERRTTSFSMMALPPRVCCASKDSIEWSRCEERRGGSAGGVEQVGEGGAEDVRRGERGRCGPSQRSGSSSP